MFRLNIDAVLSIFHRYNIFPFLQKYFHLISHHLFIGAKNAKVGREIFLEFIFSPIFPIAPVSSVTFYRPATFLVENFVGNDVNVAATFTRLSCYVCNK